MTKHTLCVKILRKGDKMTTTSNKIRTNVYLDSTTKQKAQEIFKQYGLGLSEAFNIFLTQSVLEKGIPFEIKIPNEKTIEAIKDARANKNIKKVSLDDLKKEL
ncbi:Antitoxin DinJ [Arcobacter porcinus]|nr:Antitoxin DinJ [Arcobacter porcinus]OCL87171.1 Antitoxin DinJ [Arcobacter porcinus]OCL89683.1 Antitoxin DinJ [Aliarcobacter thereius]